jgi:hypothetical protein
MRRAPTPRSSRWWPATGLRAHPPAGRPAQAPAEEDRTLLQHLQGLEPGKSSSAAGFEGLEAARREIAEARSRATSILRPGHRLVLTSWQPRTPGDARLPSRLGIDWAAALRSVGFVDVQVASRAEWHELFTRVYRVALDLGGPGEDIALAGLQGEARRHLPIAELFDRVVVIATRPDGGVAAGPAG